MSSRAKVHVLVIEHKHGTSISAYSDHDLALSAVFSWVYDNWDEGYLGPRPSDPEEATERYFKDNGDETWHLDAVDFITD